jgi:hypothetical protein
MNIVPKNSYINRFSGFASRKLTDLLSVKAEENAKIDENTELLEDLKQAKNEWVNAHYGLDYVKEDEMIDYTIYILKAYQSRYEFLLRKAKERGLKAQ